VRGASVMQFRRGDLEKGGEIVVCRRNRPGPSRPAEKRPLGLAKGTFFVPDSFFDEQPEETIALFSDEAP